MLRVAIITEETYDTDFVKRKYLDKMIENGKIKLLQTEENLAKYNRIYLKNEK